jgi:transposase
MFKARPAGCRLKDFRRVATRYDQLARNFLAAVQGFFPGAVELVAAVLSASIEAI